MKTFWVCLVIFMLGVLALMGWKIYLDSPISKRDHFLSPEFYYELPSGGYVYVEEEYIRYNLNNFDGTLDYQITLNYNLVYE